MGALFGVFSKAKIILFLLSGGLCRDIKYYLLPALLLAALRPALSPLAGIIVNSS